MQHEHLPPLPTMPKTRVASQRTFNAVAVFYVILSFVAAYDIIAVYRALAHEDRRIELAERV